MYLKFLNVHFGRGGGKRNRKKQSGIKDFLKSNLHRCEIVIVSVHDILFMLLSLY